MNNHHTECKKAIEIIRNKPELYINEQKKVPELIVQVFCLPMSRLYAKKAQKPPWIDHLKLSIGKKHIKRRRDSAMKNLQFVLSDSKSASDE